MNESRQSLALNTLAFIVLVLLVVYRFGGII